MEKICQHGEEGAQYPVKPPVQRGSREYQDHRLVLHQAGIHPNHV